MMDSLKTTGLVFNIQRYSIHDGCGIRTIVFFKGCFFRCIWCCNPESQHLEPQEMRADGKPKTVGRIASVAELLTEIERDRAYYAHSGGGLTISGGEALRQPEFARCLLMGAKARGLHTSMESTAAGPYSGIIALLPYLDDYLMDIKHTCVEKHERFTGRTNADALQNAMKIAQSGLTNLTIRVPVIPGFNATHDEVSDIARFASTLPGVREIHLLPYHAFGSGKYASLGRVYEMSDATPPSDIEMAALKSAAEAASGLYVQIGG